MVRTAEPNAFPMVEEELRHNPTWTAQTSTINVAQCPRLEADADRYPLRSRRFSRAVFEILQEKSYLNKPAPAVMTMPMVMAVTDPKTGAQMEYRDLMKHPTMKKIWIQSFANEFGRLAQGIKV